MAGAGETARLEMFRDLLSDAHRALDLQFGFELWDGSTIPADLPSYAMRLVIRRESVVAALLRRPNLDTALNAYVSGLLDLKNGTIFDLADQRPRGKVGRQLKGIGKLKALKDRLSFPARAGRHAAPARPGRGQGGRPRRQAPDQQAERRLPLRRVERVLSALPRPGDGLYLRLFPAGLARRHRPRSTSTSST